MAINYKKGNLFDEKVQALVNTVNTVGVMGKGIALQFKERYPKNFEAYHKAHKNGKLQVGKMLVTPTMELQNPKYIINFPTKQHWRGKSQMVFIEEGLKDLVEVIKANNIQSIAIPPLGCGNGGLKWEAVKPLMEKVLSELTIEVEESTIEVEVILFEPSEIAYTSKRKRTKKAPELTQFRSLILNSIIRYKELEYDLTILEVHKLAYLLQRLGANLGLQFERHLYGPYADNLRHALDDLEGYYLDGTKYKEAKAFDRIKIEASKIPEIEQSLQKIKRSEDKEAFAKLSELIDGFESPLGMELLATIDYLANEDKTLLQNTDLLLSAIANWSNRKAKLMKPYYVEATVSRLKEFETALLN
ncbi:MAG: macro domain-containing protein [Chitinophagales bacterium]